MTHPIPPVQTGPVETKVKVATAVSTVIGFLVALDNALAANSVLLGSLPGWSQFLILTLVPALATFWTAYATTNR